MQENLTSPRTARRRYRRQAAILSAVAICGLTVTAVTPASAAPSATELRPAAARAGAAGYAEVPKPTIVLVHGAFADASSWNPVIARLQRLGYPVVAEANPLRDLNGDAAYLSSVLSAIPGPVILVGHSYGGEVITDAAVGHPNVKALVYIAAFAPDQGESGVSILSKFAGSKLPQTLVVRPYPGGAEAYINPAQFRAVFAADLPAEQTAIMAASQRPVGLAALETPSGVPAWKTIPSWYLVAGADQAIPPAAEEFMAERAHAHTEVIPGASHVVMISHPDQATLLIVEAAEATG
jgi:pimeloyl-ACP methyl ester carboxylesterase